MSTRTRRSGLVAGGIGLLALGGIALVPAQAARPTVVEAILGRFIVTLQDSVSDPGDLARRQTGSKRGSVDRVFGSALKGYSASLTSSLLSSLLGDPQVKAVEPDTPVSVEAIQRNPPPGVDRVDQRSLPLSGSYTYGSAGWGVRAYVIDTGARRDHPDFAGRVTGGFNVLSGNTDTSDCNGHGTHVAGTLAGATYGIAKGAAIVPVKVFGCGTSTPLSAIIAGVDWATADHRPGQPAVANLSLTATAASPALDRAIISLSNDGVAVAVAAGNRSADACATSPGRAAQVLTVAATDANDAMPGFSNGGPCVDLFAPGTRIVSADSRSNGSAVLSGTSMASPHVAGALAREMSVRGTTAQQAQNRLLARSTAGKVSGTGQRCVASGCRPATAANRLLFTG